MDRRTVLTAMASSIAVPTLAPAQPSATQPSAAQPSAARPSGGVAPGRLALYANVGPDLIHYDVDVEAATLTRRGAITLPDSVQYAWPHRSRRFLYVATSSTAPGNGAAPSNSHHLVALRIGADGALTAHGAPVPLPTRPIHLSTDTPSENILVAFNKPAALRVYGIRDDFTLGEEVHQANPIDAGIYAHQVRVTPDNATAILVTRGNEGTATQAEEPGALKVFDYARGQLAREISIAPDGGHDFGPRHLDFHPTKPWIYLSIETQNQVCLIRMANGRIGPDLLFRTGTLAEPGRNRARQAAGPIHVHPNGRFLYGSNRAEQTEDHRGTPVFKGGENGIVVYGIDDETGEPTPIQHVDTRGIHPRTFHIDLSGRILVAEHNLPVAVRDGEGARAVPAGLSVFRIGSDGRLDFVRKYDHDVKDQTMFWMGMVQL